MRLADPLVHLIRNAIDHGIEAPGRRAAAAKAATGRITLTAEHVGAQVCERGATTAPGSTRHASARKGRGEGPVRDRRGAHRPAGLPVPVRAGLLHRPGDLGPVGARGSAWTSSRRRSRACAARSTSRPSGGRHDGRPAPAADAGDHRGIADPGGGGALRHPLAAVEECVELPAGERGGRGRDFLNIRGALVAVPAAAQPVRARASRSCTRR